MNTQARAHPPASGCEPLRAGRRPFRRAMQRVADRFDGPLTAIALLLLALAALAPTHLWPSLRFTGDAIVGIAPWLLISVACAAYVKASGLDAFVARAFSGGAVRMIVLASVFGAVSPFCSCGVIPIIAGLLAAGVPLAPVMAFWLSSPLMDPNMFALTAATLGMEFAIVKTLAAIGIGLFSGAATHFLAGGAPPHAVLRLALASCADGAPIARTSNTVQWNVFAATDSRRNFFRNAVGTAWFLFRWMAFAFLLESLMVAWLPADSVIAFLGEETMAIPAGVLVGMPAYLNGFAALPLMAGLVELGMNPAVALAFLVAGGIASIPAAAAVWALTRPRVFVLYLGLGVTGSLLAAYTYGLFTGAHS
jgi:uncharacterized protein